jgi:hypothetical protein
MLSLKTLHSIHNNRRSPQLDSRQAPQPASARRLTVRNQTALPNRQSSIPGKQNDPSPIFGHSAPQIRRPFLANTLHTASRTSSPSIRLIPRNLFNTNQIPLRLSVSASKRPSPSHPLNPGYPNDPNPIFGRSPTPPRAKSATHSPVPPLLPLTSSPPKLHNSAWPPNLRASALKTRSPTLKYSLPKPRQSPPSRPLDCVDDA